MSSCGVGKDDIPCSTNSHCVNNFCKCDTGWTNNVDFQLSSSGHCDINTFYVIILSALVGTLSILVSIYICYRFIYEKLWVVGKRAKDKFVMNISLYFMSLLSSIYLVRFDNRNRVVGIDPLLTIVSIGVMISFVIGNAAYFISLIKFFKGFSMMIRDPSRRDIVNVNLNILSTTFYMIPIICISLHSPIYIVSLGLRSKSVFLLSANLVILSFTFLSSIIPVTYLYRMLISELGTIVDNGKTNKPHVLQLAFRPGQDNASVNSDVKNLLRKVNITSYLHVSFLAFGALSTLIFVSLSFLQKKVLYLDLLLLLEANFLGLVMVWTLAVPSKTKPQPIQIEARVDASVPTKLSSYIAVFFPYTPSTLVSNKVMQSVLIAPRKQSMKVENQPKLEQVPSLHLDATLHQDITDPV